MSDETAIRDLIERWISASRAGDVETVLDLMADDVVFTVPGREPFGKDVFAENSRAMQGVKFEGSYDIVELKIMGDWAWLRIYLRVSVTLRSGQVMKQAGYTLSILAKGPDGHWLLKRDANCLVVEK